VSNTVCDKKLRIAGIVDDSITDGPGLRLAVFLQGCDKDCEGCHNQGARAMEGGKDYTVEELWKRVKRNPLISGVTLSGGEPLLQAAALVPFSKMVREAGLDLMVYTGYTFEEIVAMDDADVFELLEHTNILVDGPFVAEKRDLTLRFRGSSNQRLLDAGKSVDKKTAVLFEGI